MSNLQEELYHRALSQLFKQVEQFDPDVKSISMHRTNVIEANKRIMYVFAKASVNICASVGEDLNIKI